MLDFMLVTDNFNAGHALVRSYDGDLLICISEGYYARVPLFVLDFMCCCGYVIHGYDLYSNFLLGSSVVMFEGCRMSLRGGGLRVHHDGDVVLSGGVFGSYTGIVSISGYGGDFRLIFGDVLRFGEIPFIENDGDGGVFCVFEDNFEVPDSVAIMVLAHSIMGVVYVGRTFFEACLRLFCLEQWRSVWLDRFIANYRACERHGFDCRSWLSPAIVGCLNSRAVDRLREKGLLD